MKKSYFKFIALGSLVVLTLTYSCKKLLNTPPVGSLSASVLANKAGLDGLLIGAYHMLSGFSTSYGGDFESGIDNWSEGGIASDDAYKGSNTTDQAPFAPEIENHTLDAANGYIAQKWQVSYDGVQRANDVIREIPLIKDGSVSAAYGAEAIAEARFLRGVFHMEVAKVFRNAPYVDETVTYAAGNYNVANAGPIWANIEADFTAAMAGLPNTQSQLGRANKYAAEAMLAYANMFDHKYATAIPLLTDLINNGVTSSGAHYALGPYEDNFNAAHNNSPESVFAVQMTVNDGSNGNNGNPGQTLNFPSVGNTTCCGFYQPSITLGNAFQVDANGLPLLGYTGGIPNSNMVNIPSDHGYGLDPGPGPTAGQYRLQNVATPGAKATFSGPPFTPPNTALDPRIDWTLGRYGIPYLDWGLCGGEQWSRGDVTPYNPIKNVFWHSQQATTADAASGWAPNQDDSNNYNLVRFADVYLWRAEAEAATNDLASALADVNVIRNRMAMHQEYWVKTYVDNANPSSGFTNTNAANYKISPYPAGAFTTQAIALNAVEVERQLETGMEGRRFFDLQRYDPIFGGPEAAGFMAGIENAHITQDVKWLNVPTIAGYVSNPVLNGHSFTGGKNELFPIPINQIDIDTKLKQNPGY